MRILVPDLEVVEASNRELCIISAAFSLKHTLQHDVRHHEVSRIRTLQSGREFLRDLLHISKIKLGIGGTLNYLHRSIGEIPNYCPVCRCEQEDEEDRDEQKQVVPVTRVR